MPHLLSPVARRQVNKSFRRALHAVSLLRPPSGEVAAATVLLSATLIALVWANLPGSTYHDVWATPLYFEFGSLSFGMDLHHWINDALMALFFAFLTLEVRREIEMGELRDRRRAAVPVLAAAVGLALPAALFLAVTADTDAAAGWGVVVSTDTAFVLGVLALVGRRMPAQLRVFLVTLAVADDIGALAIIALFYTDELKLVPILVALAGLAIIALLRRLEVWRGAIYLMAAVLVWVALYESGVHATLAGVVIALLLPIFPTSPEHVTRARRLMSAFAQSPSPTFARLAEDGLQRAVSVNERAHRQLLPYVNFLILPLFALANAGVHITPDILKDAFTSELTWGIILGLTVGKTVGITATAAIAQRVRPGALPPGLRISHIGATAVLSGIGFTLSLFVADLAFDDETTLGRAQIGILSASLLAAVIGSILFRILDRRERSTTSAGTELRPPITPERDHTRGPADTPLNVVLYGSFTCGFCAASAEVMDELRAHFGQQMSYTFRHLPAGLPFAREFALASEVAAQQGRFWQFYDAVFASQPITNKTQLYEAASRAGMNLRLLRNDLSSESVAHRVEEDETAASDMGLNSTPALFIQGELYEGAKDADTLVQILENRLTDA